MQISRKGILLAGGSCLITLAGCSKELTVPSPEQSSSPTPVASPSSKPLEPSQPISASAPPSAPSPAVSVVSIEDERDLDRLETGPRGVLLRSPDRDELSATAYVAGVSEPLTLTAHLEAHERAISTRWAVEQDPTMPFGALLCVHCERLGSGLEGATESVRGFVFDESGELRNSLDLPLPEDAWNKAGASAGLQDASLVSGNTFVGYISEESWYLAALDPTGRLRWTLESEKPNSIAMANVEPGSTIDSTRALYSKAGVIMTGGKSGNRLVQIPDGKVLETVPVLRAYRQETKQAAAGIITACYNGCAAIVSESGASVGPINAESLMVDPVAKVLITSYKDNFEPAFVVTDLVTGKQVFSLGKSASKRLGQITVLGAYGGTAYLWTQDGVKVVNSRDGKSVPDFSQIAPGVREVRNVPILSSDFWVLTGNSNGDRIVQLTSFIGSAEMANLATELPSVSIG